MNKVIQRGVKTQLIAEKTSSTLVKLDPKASTSYQEKLEAINKYNEEFMKKHRDRMVAWEKNHKGRPVPVATDKAGRYFWINRAQRRKMKK